MIAISKKRKIKLRYIIIREKSPRLQVYPLVKVIIKNNKVTMIAVTRERKMKSRKLKIRENNPLPKVYLPVKVI